MILALLCAVAQGAWATDYNVGTDSELRSAIQNNDANITVTADIDLSNSTLSIESGKTVTIDLNGHTLDRKLTKRGEGGGQVITVREGATLNLTGGTLTGGWGGAGGALVNEGGTVTLADVIITNNVADDRGGGICNREGGTLTMTGGAITDNGSNDNSGAKGGGGFFNEENATATLTGVTITGNKAKLTGGGGICNFGTLTIDGCTITGNTAGTYGGGIWQEGTLNMQGAMSITGNTTAGSVTNNLFLKTGALITVTGALSGSSIGINMESISGTFTSGFGTYNSGVDPSTIFTSDCEVFRIVSQNGEGHFVVDYIKRRWDDKNKQVVNTTMTLTHLIGYNDVPTAGDYKEVKPVDGWFALGGFSNDDEYYVVRGNVSHTTLNVLGKKVHLILCDGAKLTLSGGILCYNTDSNKPTLYIHCQSYGASMGRLDIASGYKSEAAGIGSDYDGEDSDHARTPGDIEIHGGDIYAKGGGKGAGIGGGNEQNGGNVIIYGGKVVAQGGKDLATAGIGGGVHGGLGHLTIYDGTVYAYGGGEGAGIGTGTRVGSVESLETVNNVRRRIVPNIAYTHEYKIVAIGIVDIYGGHVEAYGGNNAAGIGGGYLSNGVFVTVNGGEVYAYGIDDGAGIGGGWNDRGGSLTVNGGKVYAKGGGNGAGIGSGSIKMQEIRNIDGGEVTITGGEVYAYGGVDAAGIGGGEGGDCGTVKISGGYVYAEGNDYGAGIGGGQGGIIYGGNGGDVTITGGIVIAKAGRQARPEVETGNRAIGPGEGCDIYGTLTIGNNMMVQAGYDGDNYERIFTAGERVGACWYRSSARIEPCTHTSLTYTVNGTGVGDTHTAHCKYCTTEFTPEQHTFSNGVCTVCGVESTTTLYTVRTYLPKKVSEAYDGQTYECQTTQMASGTAFTMPDCPTTVPGLEFVGWEVSNVTANPYTSAYTTTGGTIKKAGDEYTISGNVSFIARYQNLDITLVDNATNGEVLSTHNGMTAHSVTLSGRTLYKDGKWNTLCLPFALSAEQLAASPLANCELMELDTDAGSYAHITGFDAENGTLYLNFKTAESIEAGKAYIVKWDDGEDITNPIFENVTINNVLYGVTSEDGKVAFAGIYSPRAFKEEDKTILYMGNNNKLYYPSQAMTINAFRGYFQLKGIEASKVAATKMWFGDEDEATSINGLTPDPSLLRRGEIYNLSGQRLSRPQKGINIVNGRKVLF